MKAAGIGEEDLFMNNSPPSLRVSIVGQASKLPFIRALHEARSPNTKS